MALHPVQYRSDYVEPRSRLSTFFRLLLAIPHLIVLSVYGFAAFVVVFIAWFALVLTGRWPQGMYGFVAGYMRYAARVYGYLALLTDAYPPFSGDAARAYPVDLRIAPPKERYSRLKALFRVILAIPVMLINYAMQLVFQTGALLAWFAIVVLGRQPKGLQEMTDLGLSYYLRSMAYFLLVTEEWPPFSGGAQDGALDPGPSGAPLPSGPETQLRATFAPPEAPRRPEPPDQAA